MNKRRRALAVLTTVAIGVGWVGASSSGAAPSPLGRDRDPVVVSGADVPNLVGVRPAGLVAFRYDGGWQQVPVQVDERAPVDLATIYRQPPNGVVRTVYTDPNTWTGPDPDPSIDADDEIVVMAKDAGTIAPVGLPSGTLGKRTRLTVTDPIGGASGYVYLFSGDGTLRQDAGRPYVSYTFGLLAGSYKTAYDVMRGPNPENSTVDTAAYTRHFADRWVDDVLRDKLGTGTDILDRHKFSFKPGDCFRTEDKFSGAEGAFVANISGPVRAIRSYMGAVSGPFTQREHVYYERRQDVRTYLRVHDISGAVDFYDYSPAASGMTYRNNNDVAGVTVNGVRDSVTAGPLTWESVTGAQGSVTFVHSTVTNITGITPTSYYLDTTSPSGKAETQCTGDRFAYASSGPWVNQPIPSTDPVKGSTKVYTGYRTLYYDPPGVTAAQSAARVRDATEPLTVVGVAE